MKPALVPWMFPLAVLGALIIAAINSPLVDVIAYLVVLFGVVPLGFSWLRRHDMLPPYLARLLVARDANGRPRFPDR